MSEAMPRPWRLYRERSEQPRYPGIESPDATVVIWGDDDPDDDCGVRGETFEIAIANADLIVKAVNCHDELLAACKVVLAYLDNLESKPVSDPDLASMRQRFHQPLRAALEPAIANAEGRQ